MRDMLEVLFGFVVGFIIAATLGVIFYGGFAVITGSWVWGDYIQVVALIFTAFVCYGACKRSG